MRSARAPRTSRGSRRVRTRSIARLLLLLAAAIALYALRRPKEEDLFPDLPRGPAGAGGLEGPGAGTLPVRSGEVSTVTDGDSIVLVGGIQVRYLGVDAPEWGEPFSEAARQVNGELVLGRDVKLEPGGPEPLDAYGRTLAVVFCEPAADGGRVCVNVELVRRGLASVYVKGPRSIRTDFLDELLGAQAEAIAERRGVWPERLSRSERSREALVTTRFRIHRADCQALGGARTQKIGSPEREFRKGKSLCRSCRPLERP